VCRINTLPLPFAIFLHPIPQPAYSGRFAKDVDHWPSPVSRKSTANPTAPNGKDIFADGGSSVFSTLAPRPRSVQQADKNCLIRQFEGQTPDSWSLVAGGLPPAPTDSVRAAAAAAAAALCPASSGQRPPAGGQADSVQQVTKVA